MLRVGTILRGIYRIDSYLSSGGFGNTYVATNIEFEERVAIKEFFMKGITERDEATGAIRVSNGDNVVQFEEQREKFKKEARRLRKLKNEHIVKVHDLFEENGTAYYVMDFIDGESLAERMKKTGQPFSETEVRHIQTQILEALKEVHQTEIWHLDLKPGNIMIDKGGNAYLIDFGASKQIRANGSMTTSTALCYTPCYAPNEQIGQMYDRFGPWTDIYALGATIYNLLTNKKPPMAIDIEEDEEDAFEFPTSISEDMRKLVVWMMQPKRKARPQNVDDLIERLVQKQMPDEEKNVILVDPKTDKAEAETIDEEQTILLQSNYIVSKCAIKIGSFIFEDGTYSDKMEDNKKKCIGVLFSCYGGQHGQIFSVVKPKENMSINGIKFKWHEASVTEWVKIIQNLGKTKVFNVYWNYRFYSTNVPSLLSKYFIKETKYATGKSLSGVAYIVDLAKFNLSPMEGDNITLPYIYITEF